MSSVSIKLTTPIPTYGPAVTVLVLREPSGMAYLEHGEPISYGRTADGGHYVIENEEVIYKYILNCIPQDQLPAEHVPMIGLEDAMKVKAAVLDFFRAARDRASEKSSTFSSSTSD